MVQLERRWYIVEFDRETLSKGEAVKLLTQHCGNSGKEFRSWNTSEKTFMIPAVMTSFTVGFLSLNKGVVMIHVGPDVPIPGSN